MKNYIVIAAVLMTSCAADEPSIPASEQPDALAEKNTADIENDENDDKVDEEIDEIDEEELEHDHHEGETMENIEFYFRYGVKNLPEDEKHEKNHAGEDAWLAQSDLLMVADGVGGWEEHGVDSSLFS
jgi:hypothetical protein